MFQIANKLGKKNINAKIYQHDVIVNFFDVAAFLFSILITGLGFMPKIPEIGNTSVRVSSNISRLGILSDVKFGMKYYK